LSRIVDHGLLGNSWVSVSTRISERSFLGMSTGHTWLALTALGTLVRFGFGWHRHLWNGAPDQIAWGLSLDDLVVNGPVLYKQLIHYPHEGGTLFLSILSLLFRPFSSVMPPLSWAALFTDSLARYIQIRVAERLFGRTTALWFAGWTLLAAPLMLPWATIDCGLHALISFAPFVLVERASNAQVKPLPLGLLCGSLACFAYDVWTFVPAYMLWVFGETWPWRSKLQRVGIFLVGCLLAFAPHMCLRAFADNGFRLEQMSTFSVRGLELATLTMSEFPIRIWIVLTEELPASFMLSALDTWMPRMCSVAVLLFIALGLIAPRPWRIAAPSAMRLAWLSVLSFLLALACGPFFEHRPNAGGYLYYRYFVFIAPLLVLLMIEGFGSLGKYANAVRGSWLAICAIGSLAYMVNTSTFDTPNYRATGWVLGRKYGDDPAQVMRICAQAPMEHQEELVFGSGWGSAAALFEGRRGADTTAVRELMLLWSQYPASVGSRWAEGVRQAFAPGITPVLDPKLGQQVMEELEKKAR
jgi:hypothetical protein